MPRIAIATLCALALSSGVAVADSNASAARAMAEVLSGTPGIGSIAPTVSGKDARSASGWGNTGSLATTGTQVSRGKK